MKMKYSLANNEVEASQQKLKNLQLLYQNEMNKMNTEIAKIKSELDS